MFSDTRNLLNIYTLTCHFRHGQNCGKIDSIYVQFSNVADDAKKGEAEWITVMKR